MRAEILVGAERRRRWSVAEKLRIVREAFAPGAHVSDVALRRDVSRGQIYQWRAELRDGRLAEAGTDIVGFVPVDARFSLAIGSFRCATIASAPKARASASSRAERSASSAAFSVATSSGPSSGGLLTG